MTETLSLGDVPTPLDVDFSPRASVPTRGSIELPLPGTAAFFRLNGRAGDLIVVQIRSELGSTQGRKDALRTLGLRGVNTGSLRFNTDASTWGSVAKVRDLVSVIALPEVQYMPGINPGKLNDAISVESRKYGTPSKPAELWRDSSGEYFAYESSARGVTAFWSTDGSMADFLGALSDSGLAIDHESKNHFLVTGEEIVTGRWNKLKKEAEGIILDAISVDLMSGMVASWRSPFRRFHDMKSEHACVTLSSHPLDILALRGVFRATTSPGFHTENTFELRVRKNGKVRTQPL